MNIPVSIIPFINIILIVFVIISLILGYHKGLLYQVFSLLALLAAILISWFFAPVLAAKIDLYPRIWAPFTHTTLADIFYLRVNTLFWYVLLFLITIGIFWLIKPIAKALSNVPIIGTVNKILGAIFSLIPSCVTICFAAYLLSTPLIPNGREVLDKTALGIANSATTNIITIFQHPYQTNEAVQKLLHDPTSVTSEDVQLIIAWLTDNKVSSAEIEKFIQDYISTGS